MGSCYLKRAFFNTDTFIADLNSAKELFKAASKSEFENEGSNPRYLIQELILEVIEDPQVELFNQAIICNEKCKEYNLNAGNVFYYIII